ncbi:glycosyltransferase [Pseudomonas guariconensis]|uniref:glycosyltransferase n=1 Tax=Pseudomonas TaxID=286 RepID=UPI00209815BB|nr:MULTISPECIES: glycosyltransferase [Pseudomonas]MCO7642440.1 glycosyltransferase [Pseudomonas sp. S 311-6]MCO7516142.1 glycosyltransferase [Pseudomonas putida]MCO7566744.1 glycosyltransferase [Pseudomonas mosselii]MCO7606064.1 glycosyltransferase [Pseudomonas guariconensis]MCO7618733.1 glycosyltransferase [Pseudomonas guariconensis]
MNEQALVSIVIPAFNPRFFAMALQSALAQTHGAIEVLVCDDSEDEEIEAIVRRFEREGHGCLRYVRNSRNKGFVTNLVQCVELARGDLVKILCDDDRLFPECVARQAEALQANGEASLVLSQRMLADENDFILPMRLLNTRFASVDSLFKGEDMLALLDGRPINFLGNFSAALMRREQALQWLQALTGDGQGFVALLDLALFACLMRRGNLIVLSEPALIERLHPQRLSKQAEVAKGVSQEWRWLMQMLAARSGEPAPASGWVRYIPLAQAEQQPRSWQELCVARILSNWQTRLNGRVGGDCESYAELYQQWLNARRFSDVQRSQLPRAVAAWPRQPRIVPVVMDLDGDAFALAQTLDSLERQLYPVHACVVLGSEAPDSRVPLVYQALQADWVQQLNLLLVALPDADWIYLLRAGDQLAESAILVLAERIAVLPGLACAYSDEGTWIDGKPAEPVFKPGFNLDLLRSYPYLGRTLAFEREAILELGGLDATYAELAPHDLVWRLVETRGPQVIEHIAEIQVQSTLSFAQWLSLPGVIEQSERVLGAHLQRLGIDHRIRHDDLPLLNRVDYLHVTQPLVSILLPVGRDLARLQACVEGLIERTAQVRYEVLLVADAEVDPAMAGWLQAMAELETSLLRVPAVGEGEPTTLLDNAAAQARGDYLLLFSTTLEPLGEQWLAELLQHAQRPEVAVVGGKQVDARGRVVDAGTVLGVSSVAGPAFAGESVEARGYLQRLQVVQNWSAVSGDCLLVRKAVFEALGGLGGQRLERGLAELDLCLRAGHQGYLVVGTPYAVLLKCTSEQPAKTLDQERQLEQQQVFCERWLGKVVRDPAYNPNLGLAAGNFTLEPSLRGSWSPLCARALPSILGLPINDSAVGHYRVIEPFSQLEAAGRAVGRIAFESPSVVQLARMDPDAIILQLRHADDSVRDIERIARFSNARRIFEIDDYVLSAPKKNTHARNKPADIEQHLRRGIGLCDRVVVTTQALANALSDMHSDIRVVPNMLAPRLWLGLSSQRGVSRKPRVGWGGGTSHSGDLEIIAEVVRELANEVEWVFFGMCPDDLKPYIHEYHAGVSLQAYPAKLASLNLDLALAPLEFHIFNDCKSNLRLLEYGACGYPTICTDTEAYRGYLPCTRVQSNSTEEWLQAIRMHLADPVASYRMGDELREAVLRDFVLRDGNLQHWEWGWLAD